MTFLLVILLAAIEGAAGMLLLSGDGHLLIFEKLFGLAELPYNFLYFAVVLHVGNLLAVLLRYRSEVRLLGRELLRVLHILKTPRQERKHPPVQRRELLHGLLALLPMLAALALTGLAQRIYRLDSGLLPVGIGLLVSGLALFLSERFYRGSKDEKNVTPLDALLIGLAQAPTVLPGLSRGALSTAVGVMCGLKRDYAVRFSCLLSVPVILVALIFETVSAGAAGLLMPPFWLCLAGIAVSTAASTLALRLLERIAQYGRLDNLAYWCWGMGILSLALVLIT